MANLILATGQPKSELLTLSVAEVEELVKARVKQARGRR